MKVKLKGGIKMQPLKKPTQLKRWGEKNKISNKKFSRLTGLSLKKISKSKKLPKIVKLGCLAIEGAKKKSDQKKEIQVLKKKNKNLKAKIIKFKKPNKNVSKLKKVNKKLESKLKKPNKNVSKLKKDNKKLASKLNKPKKVIKKLKSNNKKLKARLIKGDKKATKTSQSTGKNMSKTKKIDLTKSNGSLDKVSTQNINIKTDITSPTSEEKPETTK
jgi:predicted RNase H-like nuclease (RuvC/YqgF family)